MEHVIAAREPAAAMILPVMELFVNANSTVLDQGVNGIIHVETGGHVMIPLGSASADQGILAQTARWYLPVSKTLIAMRDTDPGIVMFQVANVNA